MDEEGDEENQFKELELGDDDVDLEDENLDPENVNKMKISEKDIKKQKKSNKPERDPLEQNEDLSATVFVKGIPLEINEARFLKFCEEIGEVEYAKVVKMKDKSNRHNGNGFAKFKDGELANRVIQMTENLDRGSYIPREDDPNLFLTGSRVKFLPCISKRDAFSKKQKRSKELKEKY